MPGFADVYVLVSDRSPGLARRFLDRFLPRRRELAAEYEVSRFSDAPQVVFQEPDELMEYCYGHPNEPHAIYWRNTPGDPSHAMVFYTSDGAMILGLSTEPPKAERLLAELEAFASSMTGYITFEAPPPDTAVEFRALAGEGG